MLLSFTTNQAVRKSTPRAAAVGGFFRLGKRKRLKQFLSTSTEGTEQQQQQHHQEEEGQQQKQEQQQQEEEEGQQQNQGQEEQQQLGVEMVASTASMDVGPQAAIVSVPFHHTMAELYGAVAQYYDLPWLSFR